MYVRFSRTTPDGQYQETTAQFKTSPQILSNIDPVNTTNTVSKLLSSVEYFKLGGSWFILVFIFQ